MCVGLKDGDIMFQDSFLVTELHKKTQKKNNNNRKMATKMVIGLNDMDTGDSS